MTHPKRFRDMSLTERELDDLVSWMRRDCYLRTIENPDIVGISEAYLDRFEARAKRLLPLWRQWGLSNCRAAGYSAGYDSGRECGPDEECV